VNHRRGVRFSQNGINEGTLIVASDPMFVEAAIRTDPMAEWDMEVDVFDAVEQGAAPSR